MQQTIAVVCHAAEALYRVPNGVAPVEDSAKTIFFRVERNHLGLDGHRPAHNLIENGALALLDELHLLLTDLK